MSTSRHTPAENRADFARVLAAIAVLALLAAWDRGDRSPASAEPVSAAASVPGH